MFWFHMPDPDTAYPESAPPPDVVGPPAGHPERMCRGIPLTRVELMLMAEIDAIGDSAK